VKSSPSRYRFTHVVKEIPRPTNLASSRFKTASSFGTSPIRSPLARQNFGIFRARKDRLHLSHSQICCVAVPVSVATKPSAITSITPSSFLRGWKNVALESYIFKIALDEFASSPQLPHTRSSGSSISCGNRMLDQL